VAGGSHYNITGNYIDRSGTSAIAVLPRGGRPSRHLAISGNVIYRSGKWADAETHDSSQVRLEGSRGITCLANTLVAGRDDGGRGNWSPSHGFVCNGLENCVVKDNVLDDGALKQLVLDLGGHNDGFLIKDNPGRLFRPEA
jgi:hypothetical protein